MIVLFQISSLIIIKIVKKLKYLFFKENEYDFNVFENDTLQPLAFYDKNKCVLKFDPPVYKQRYAKVVSLLSNDKWKNKIHKIVDFGCSEFNFFLFLKQMKGLHDVYFVDVDEDVLKDQFYKILPITIDHINMRNEPLNIKIFCGSVSDPDPNLLDRDAVIAIELIEHLYPDDLEAAVYNIFSYIEPKLIIFTTPNYDFNLCLNNIKNFRHFDHKFEWTRKQFQEWSKNLIVRYPNYIVSHCGIGCGPIGKECYGCCSQLAIFMRKDLINDNYIINSNCKCLNLNCDNMRNSNLLLCPCNCKKCRPKLSFGVCKYFTYIERNSNDSDLYYELINTINYPYDIDLRTEEEKKIDEIKFRILRFGNSFSEGYYNVDRQRAEIPLKYLNYGINYSDELMNQIDLRNIIIKIGYNIEKCLVQSEFCDCVIYIPDMGSRKDSTNPSDATEYNSENNFSSDELTPIWGENETNWNTNNKDKQKNNKENNKKSGPSDSVSEPETVLSDPTMKYFKFKSPNFKDFSNTKNEGNEENYLDYTSSFPDIKLETTDNSMVAGPSIRLFDDTEEIAQNIAFCIIENSLNKINVSSYKGELIEEFMDEIQEDTINENNLVNERNNNEQEDTLPVVNNVLNNLESNINYQSVSLDDTQLSLNNTISNKDDDDDDDDYNCDYEDVDNNYNSIDEIEKLSHEAVCDSESQLDLSVDCTSQNDIEFFAPPITPIIVTEQHAQNIFPDWLLRMLAEGENAPHEHDDDIDIDDDDDEDEDDGLDFYSQGDYLGIHPSVVTVAVNENDDTNSSEESDTTTTTTEQITDHNLERQNSILDINEGDEENELLVRHSTNQNQNPSDLNRE